jgi:hypothetical protein
MRISSVYAVIMTDRVGETASFCLERFGFETTMGHRHFILVDVIENIAPSEEFLAEYSVG